MTIMRTQDGAGVSTSNPLPAGGAAAHDAVNTGNPMKVGGRAVTASYAVSATNDVTDLASTMNGYMVIKPYSIPENEWQYAAVAGGILVNTDVVAKAAAGATLRNYISGFQLQNAGATATEFVIKDGATVIWRGFLPANMTAPVDFTFVTPLRGTLNTAVNIQAVTASTIYANVQGFMAA